MSSSTPTTTDSTNADGTAPDYSPESGHNAELAPILNAIKHVFKRETGKELPDDFSKNLDWNSPRDREFVQDQLTDSDDLNDGEAILPGFGPHGRGRTARDDCGDAHPFVCNQCGAALEMGRTCSMSVCSRCGAVWVRDTGAKKMAKVRRIRREKNRRTPQDENQLEHHVVISAPPEWYAALGAAGLNFREAHNVTKEVVKLILKELRAVGVVARHSYRGANDDGSLVDEPDDRGEWRHRLNAGRDWYGDVRDELGWMPHYHGIVVSDWIEGGQLTKQLQAKTGWIIHRITGRDNSKKSFPNDRAMGRGTIYMTSHSDIWLNAGANEQNLSQIWTVGSVHNPETGERDAVKSHPDFTPTEHDRQWAAQVAKDNSQKLLGLNSADTDCGEEFPPVDEPDELARRIIEELWPDHDARRDVNADVVLEHVAEGNITVDPTTDADGRLTDVTVSDAWGDPVGPDGWKDTSLPEPSTTSLKATPAVLTNDTDDTDDTSDNSNAECDHHNNHSQDNDDRTCSGRLIPLGAFREKGYLDDPDWCRNAPNVDEARAIDDEWSDDLDLWQATSLATEAPPRPVPD